MEFLVVGLLVGEREICGWQKERNRLKERERERERERKKETLFGHESVSRISPRVL